MERELIIEFYSAYINLIKKYIQEQGKAVWLAPGELSYIENYKKTPWNKYYSNSFILEVADNKISLGEDIIKNGMYWPFLIAEHKDHIYPVVLLGYHRIEALKMYYKKNNTPISQQHKFLCIYLNTNHFQKIVGSRIEFNKNTIHSKNLTTPFTIELPEKNILIKKTAYTYGELYFMIKAFPEAINDNLFKFHRDEKLRIRSSPVINKEDYYNDWIKK